jgi:cytoskeletal protein RodZ
MSSLEYEQDLNQKLVEIGAQLKEIRHQHDLSLEEISAKTLIPTRLLKAIEEGKMEQLPEPVYTKGFIRRFGDALGLNGATLAESFPVVTKPLPKYEAQPGGRLKSGLRPIHLYLFYILVIVAAGIGLSYLNKPATQPLGGETQTLNPSENQDRAPAFSASPATASSPSPGQRSTVASQPLAAASPSSAPQPSGVTSTGETPKPSNSSPEVTPKPAVTAPGSARVRVDLTLKQDAWVAIEVDGKTTYEGILKAKTNRTVIGKNKIVIHSGNAGGVLVSANQKPAQPMGELGNVKTLTVDRNT